MRFFYTVLIILSITTFVSWLNYRLLTRIFIFIRQPMVRYVYLIFTMVTVLVLGYGWTRRPPFVLPEVAGFKILVYVTLAWALGQLTLLAMQPLVYVIHRLIMGHKAAHVPAEITSGTMTRRVFLHNALAITPMLAFGISTKGIYGAQTDMVVQRYSLSYPSLPTELRGFKIAQLSDSHLGPYFDLAKLDRAIQLLIQEKPDLVAITGDFADDLALLKPAIDKLDALRTSIPCGVYFCMGNHDYFRSADLVRAELNRSGIVLLDNSNRLIVRSKQPFFLMGVDYPWSDLAHTGINVSENKRREYFATACMGIPAEAFTVLIGHHPDILFDGFDAGIPLTLAGHTHGGQVVIGEKPVLNSYHYMRGLYGGNGVYGYVNSGVGHWFPFRLNCPPEISVFTFQ